MLSSGRYRLTTGYPITLRSTNDFPDHHAHRCRLPKPVLVTPSAMHDPAAQVEPTVPGGLTYGQEVGPKHFHPGIAALRAPTIITEEDFLSFSAFNIPAGLLMRMFGVRIHHGGLLPAESNGCEGRYVLSPPSRRYYLRSVRKVVIQRVGASLEPCVLAAAPAPCGAAFLPCVNHSRPHHPIFPFKVQVLPADAPVRRNSLSRGPWIFSIGDPVCPRATFCVEPLAIHLPAGKVPSLVGTPKRPGVNTALILCGAGNPAAGRSNALLRLVAVRVWSLVTTKKMLGDFFVRCRELADGNRCQFPAAAVFDLVGSLKIPADTYQVGRTCAWFVLVRSSHKDVFLLHRPSAHRKS